MLAVTFGMSRLEHLCIRYLEVIINLKNVLVNNFENKLFIDYVITVGDPNIGPDFQIKRVCLIVECSLFKPWPEYGPFG